MSDELILHHYETSPFSEKVRVVMGLKARRGGRRSFPTCCPTRTWSR